ncbi:hypothetical protein KVT40_007614 [Elsinoe batatas]|uniref:Chromo domain-containing protein n=1 Tax=Elsinoe batatas TaxID=2601811 RepID=A0A8K0KWE3_9PEZI|nr:hypothetical protein KVT40_007614 [Elsinoe batatas]
MLHPSSADSPTKLHSRLASHAPRSARILSREHVGAGAIPAYTLKVGTAVIPNVCLDELFDFVSPQDLEIFENAEFKRENDEKDMIQQALWQAKRRPGRPRKNRNVVNGSNSSISGSSDDVVTSSGASPEPTAAPAATGRFGRPRPDYSKMYKPRRQRGAHAAGPTRSEWKQRLAADSEQDLPGNTASLSLNENPKRRRLDQSGSHSRTRPSRTPSSSSGRGNSYSASRTSSSRNGIQHETRRGEESALREPVPEPLIPLSSLRAGASRLTSSASSTIVSSSSSSAGPKAQVASVTHHSHARPTATTIPISSATQANTSIHATYQPTISTPSSTDPSTSSGDEDTQAPPHLEDEDEQDDDDDEETYEIERIISHHLSDPRTHPAELGKKPVMLYQVKWAGYDETTWEPEASFDDKSVLETYLQRIRDGSQGSGRVGSAGTTKGKGRM